MTEDDVISKENTKFWCRNAVRSWY